MMIIPTTVISLMFSLGWSDFFLVALFFKLKLHMGSYSKSSIGFAAQDKSYFTLDSEAFGLNKSKILCNRKQVPIYERVNL